MKTLKNKKSTAYHEAGHAVAHLINGIPFEFITIRPNPKDNNLGHLSKAKENGEPSPEISSFLDPEDFYSGLRGAFILMSGYISEKLYTQKDNIWGASKDMEELWEGWFSDLPEPLTRKCFDFICEYATEVLSMEANRIKIKAIADALIEKETLSYNEILDIAHKTILKHIDK